MEKALDYQRCVAFWDQVYSEESDALPKESTTGNEALDRALFWLCEGLNRVLDFGCGNGSMLLFCAQNGTNEHIGIDLSQEAILSAKRRAEHMISGAFLFQQGGVEALASIHDASVDAIILSNIVDNLYPEDAQSLLDESARILRHAGKALIKLNQYITQQQIEEWNIHPISDNLLDDGLLLWNNTTEEWREFFSTQFEIHFETEVYYPEHDQTNRLFYLIKS